MTSRDIRVTEEPNREDAASRVKIWGEMRSGTNYAKELLHDNFDVWVGVHEGGFKHGIVEPDQYREYEYDSNLIVARHPLCNLVRRAVFEEAMGRDWTWLGLAKQYCHNYAYWLDVLPSYAPTFVVHWEDLLHDGTRELSSVGAALDLSLSDDEVRDIEERVHPAAKRRSARGGSFEREYYENEEWRDQLPHNIGDIVDQLREWGFAKVYPRLGYDVNAGELED